jgi:DNA adenine methylase
MENDEERYYSYRQRFNELVHQNLHTTQEAAEIFYYLNRTCFNGLCRFNQNGEFNVPFGTYKTINYENDFRPYRSILSRWTFSNCDIQNLQLARHDFVYADPPYDVEFTTYSAGGFSWADQVRTAEALSGHEGPVVISNQATRRVVDLYTRLGYELRRLKGPRRISCTGDRAAVEEILAIRNVEIHREPLH